MTRGLFRLYSFAVLLLAAVLSGLVILTSRWMIFRGAREAKHQRAVHHE